MIGAIALLILGGMTSNLLIHPCIGLSVPESSATAVILSVVIVVIAGGVSVVVCGALIGAMIGAAREVLKR